MAFTIPDIPISDRDMSVNPRMLRRNGRIPATIYGRGIDPVSIELDKKSFTHLYNTQTQHLVSLKNSGNATRALIKNVHQDPITFEILNVEFQQVTETEKVSLAVAVALEGDAPALKLGSSILQLLDEVSIECFPKDIPAKIVVDMTKCDQMEQTITVANLELPAGVAVTMSEDTVVVRISQAKDSSTEEEAEAAESEAGEPVAAGAE